MWAGEDDAEKANDDDDEEEDDAEEAVVEEDAIVMLLLLLLLFLWMMNSLTGCMVDWLAGSNKEFCVRMRLVIGDCDCANCVWFVVLWFVVL